MKKVFVLLSSLALLSLVLAACGPAATPPPPTPVVSVDPSVLAQKGRLLVCSDIPYAPFESFDDNGNPVGLDIDIAAGIASRLGLQLQVINSQFDTIIEAVSGGKCDIIMSDMNITADRSKQISFIHYLDVGQSILVAKGNPQNINVPTDLCGKSVAAESGTTEVDYLQGTGDYQGKGLAAD
ncbi:MAG TPA: transporter substrate-binding domain-containing protein, partial [Anaerolineales bacterium]|nr:transporter substrate-binding domain-containing protein [Anaerolineales bacterium]